MRILITGGTGLIGRALCRYWHAQGHECIVWSRSPETVPQLCSGARGIRHLQELRDEAAPDAVVNLAGAPIADRPWTPQRRQLLWDSRVALTRTLVDWMAQLDKRPGVLVSGSAVGFYGDGGEQLLDESSSPSQKDFGSRLCLAWEQEAERAREYGVRVVVVRTAPVLSSEGGILSRLRLPFRLGLGGRLGKGQQWMPWIHIADEVGLIDHLLHDASCSGPYNACAPHPVRNAEFTKQLGRVWHRAAILPAPAWVLRLMLGEMSVLLLGGQRLAPHRTLEAGYQFHYVDLREALDQAC